MLGEPRLTKFGRLCPRFPRGCTERVLGVLLKMRYLKELFWETGVLSGGRGWTPSSLDMDVVLLSFSTDTALDCSFAEPIED